MKTTTTKLLTAEEGLAAMDAIMATQGGRKVKVWRTAEEMAEVEWDGPCLATLRSDRGTTVIRALKAGGFVVILLGGRRGRMKVAKTLPALDQARAYQFGMHR